MIIKMCLVLLAGCVFVQANPLPSSHQNEDLPPVHASPVSKDANWSKLEFLPLRSRIEKIAQETDTSAKGIALATLKTIGLASEMSQPVADIIVKKLMMFSNAISGQPTDLVAVYMYP